ncbi:MAG: cache domain-containing protein [Piscinibacter sp.]|uniref:sensor histidine kinase n=1 Tax=Piscinibacter sp. TaxID=1903157 RepID=UPI001B4042E4|nr:cache domain-containing protein [Piscinibacter sp.]MBP5988610.1 cache domain-containing protein [Piscinibacter sp.]MBP6025901.1 cache domain-containing protein [Piscinibacter sp.]
MLRRFRDLPIRGKLLAMVLVPLALVLPLLGVILLAWANLAFDRLLITKVRSDLAVANGYFERVLGEVGASAAAVAESHALQLALARPASGELVTLLQRFKAREALDFVNLRRNDGTLLASDSGPDAALAAAPTLRPRAEAMRHATVEVLSLAELRALAPALLPRVTVPLVPTRNAAPTTRAQEDRAMVVLANAPVLAADGSLIGHVQAGVLLNRNLAFIDHINEIVYPAGSLPFGSQGTATLFLDDVRISTNVRLFGADPGTRAIGTRVSQTVRDAVLGEGATWLDRAFVVGDWYVSAYEPLVDGAGRRVGMLYVGFLEQPFTWLKYGALAAIGLIFFAVMIGAALLSLRGARGIFRPIEQMAQTMQRVEGGEMGARVGPVASHDEIGQLAGHLDHLLDVIAEKTRALERWNAELDAKVAERTRALEAAQQQLVRSEKLAAVGQLTASIAHEVNNPIAVIQGNLDLARELLGADAQRVAGELRLVDEQVERMRLIVTQLLQFARPNEFAGYVDEVELAPVLESCLVLVAHLLVRTNIVLRRELHATRRPAINRNELQQVIVNLLVNAVHAMPEGGTLTLATRDAGAEGVEIDVMDTGAGLASEVLAELFQPFVTHKKDGTGLGLWISRSIVERYGGDIRAANRAEGGAVFSVLLRVDGKAR